MDGKKGLVIVLLETVKEKQLRHWGFHYAP